ncbi:MAG: MFS transporter [Erythrobacter sp.]|nr:MFS transporter [Erythrobacter sp.]
MLALLLGIAVLNYADRYLLSGLVSPIKAEFGLSDGTMGLLMGPAFAVLYTTVAIPIARLADRTSRIAVVTAGCATWSLFTALTAYAESGWMLAVARIGVGIGEAAYQAPAAALIAAYFPPQQRGRALAVVGTAIYFGQILGMAGGPAIAAEYDWRAAFLAIGSVGILMAATAFVIIREPPRSNVAAASGQDRTALGALTRSIAAAPSMRMMTFGMALGTLSGVTFGLWGPALFERAYGLSNAASGSAFVLAFGLPGFFGVLLFGLVADRLSRKGVSRALVLSAVALCAATGLIAIVTWAPELWIAQSLAVPSGLLGGGWSIGILAGFQHVLPERDRATGIALALLIIGLFGNVIGPSAAGGMSDWFAAADPAQGLRLGLSLIIPTGFLGAWCIYRASRTLEADRQRLAAQAAGGVGEPGSPM